MDVLKFKKKNQIFALTKVNEFCFLKIKSGSLGVGENAEMSSDAVTITEFMENPWEEFSNALCKKEANKKVIDTNLGKGSQDSDDEYDDDEDDDDLDDDNNEVLHRDIDENDEDSESNYDDEDERIIDELENNREIKLGNKGHKGIKDKGFLAKEVPQGDNFDDDDDDDDIVDRKFLHLFRTFLKLKK